MTKNISDGMSDYKTEKVYQKECLKVCQKEYQKINQSECQKKCQSE